MNFCIPANNLLGDSATSFVALATTQVVAVANTITIIAQKGFLFDSVIDRLDRSEEFGGGMMQWGKFVDLLDRLANNDGGEFVGGGFIRRFPFTSPTLVWVSKKSGHSIYIY